MPKLTKPTGIAHRRRSVFCVCSCLLALFISCKPNIEHYLQTTPHTNNGVPWRLAYYQGGEYLEYKDHFRGFLQGLQSIGWIWVPDTILNKRRTCRDLWNLVAKHDTLPYLQLDTTMFWCAEWQNESRKRNQTNALRRFSNGEADMVIAMGTWAGCDLASDDHTVPVLVMSATDPIASGILKSPKESSYPHVYASCDPERYIRQINAFHNIIGFKRIGVVYEDTPDGRIYANLPVLEAIGRKRGFEVIGCAAPETDVADSLAMRLVKECYASIADRIDALWVQVHLGENPEHLSEILEPIYRQGVPTWSQLGERGVQAGVLLSIAERSRDDIGRHMSRVAATILNGMQPGKLPFVYKDPKAIAINLSVARRIGFEIPSSLPAVADTTYSTIRGIREEG